MFNSEEFQKNVKAIADNIPDQMKTTIGGNMNWIVSQTFIKYFQPRLEALEHRIEELENEEKFKGHEDATTKATLWRRKE